MCRMVAIMRKDGKSTGFVAESVAKALQFWDKEEGQYDGVGVAYIEDKEVITEKSMHRASNVEFTEDSRKANTMIGHVRWASAGEVVDESRPKSSKP